MSIFKGITLKRANAREFFFFLMLTTVLAILIKLSKNYTKVYSLPVKVVNVPLEKVVSTVQPEVLEVTAKLSGFALLSNQFSDFELTIDFEKLEKISSKNYRYAAETNALEFTNVFSGASEVTAIRPKEVVIMIDSLASREVSITPLFSSQYKTGYGPNGAPVLTPEKVRVVGPKEYIDTITSIQTKHKELLDVSEQIEVDLVIDSLTLHKEIKLSSYKVKYMQEVAKFTEGSFNVPIKLVNTGATDVKVFPKTVDVYFTVPIDVYESITANDFEVICDFKNRDVQNDFIAIRINKSPKEIKSTRLGTKQIKYIMVN